MLKSTKCRFHDDADRAAAGREEAERLNLTSDSNLKIKQLSPTDFV